MNAKMSKTKNAFIWAIKILRRHNVPFFLTGGFAARIYGSNRKFDDLDFFIPNEKFKCLSEDIKKYLTFGPKRYVDKHFDIPIAATLNYKGQRIDFVGWKNAKIFDKQRKKYRLYRNYPNSRTVKIKIFGILVPIVKKEELIRVKSRLMRKSDKEDIEYMLRDNNW